MIVLTVKTLDSQNHRFTVEDDITVQEFKTKIAETVNIPPDTQRIIYCGRVLQDSSKLSEYDVNGKVVHLVQRAPPNPNARPSRSTTPPPPQPSRRVLRRVDGSAMYLGSMAFPTNLMESQGFVSPPPTHSLAGSRLNVARRMLRRADAVIRLLENPTARPSEQAPPDDTHEEVTPVIEARVIVPSSEPIDQEIVISAVQNSLLTLDANATPTSSTDTIEAAEPATPSGTQSAPQSAFSSTRTSNENLASEERAEGSTSTSTTDTSSAFAENASRTSEMSELMTILTQLQVRFAPFLERYQTFMVDDPIVAAENVRSTQAMLTRVSEVLHYLGHAYHSLSDIIIRVRSPPPRPLLCRPILIQHSAIVRAGIPIQVEAQINLSTERLPAAAAPTTTNASTTTASTTTNTEPTAPPAATTTAATQAPTAQMSFGGPFLFPSLRGQTIPFQIRASATRPNTAPATPSRPQNNNNADTPPVATPATTGTTVTSGTTSTTTASSSSSDSFNFNNPDVEFFMEVTPDGITIDSMETTLVGSNQANDLLRSALTGPPPEILQSLMQMAGQFMNRGGTATTTAPTTTESTTAASTTTNGSTAQQNAGQNSQARGNTQTNPTTATHTRSTARPHVQLAHQAMQGGFDPFLPCNSHHVQQRRRGTHTHGQPLAANQPAQSVADHAAHRTEASDRTMNLLHRLMSSFENVYARRRSGAANASGAAPAGSDGGQTGAAWLLGSSDGITDLLTQGHVQGHSIFNDLLVILIRNTSLFDLLSRTRDFSEPVHRNREQILNYFRTHILQGPLSVANINRGVDRIIREISPYLEHLSSMPLRDDIDLVRSSENLLRRRLPRFIRLGSTLNANNVASFVDQVFSLIKHLVALTLRASQHGQTDVESVITSVLRRFLEGVPEEIRNLTITTCSTQLQEVILNLNASVRESTIADIIVRRSDPVVPPPGGATVPAPADNPAEQMDLDEPELAVPASGGSVTPNEVLLDDTQNLLLGAEQWRGQVPDDWVPIIARDAQKQRRQNGQGPYSDAYLSGMPSKRRKIVQSKKPETNLPQALSDTVRDAVTASGLAAEAPIEAVALGAGATPDLQTAYRNLLRSQVRASLLENDEFDPERFPNTSAYFNKAQPK